MNTDNPVLLLVRSVVATYINRHLEEPNGKLGFIIKETLETIKLPDSSTDTGGDGDIAYALKSTMEWLNYADPETTINKIDIIERVRINCSFDTEYVESLDRQLTLADTDEENTARVQTIISELKFALRDLKIGARIKNANRDINFKRGEHINIQEYLQNLQDDLKEYENEMSTGADKEGFAGRLSTEDLDTVITALEKTKVARSADGALRTGLKALNRAWGNIGILRGEQLVVGGLSGCYKSGALIDFCRWFCLHNKPAPKITSDVKKPKKPIVVRFSFENQLEQDTPIIYRTLWEPEHQQKLDMADIDPMEAGKYIVDKLGANGIAFEILSYDPNAYDVWDLIDDLNKYEAAGYEIYGIIVDYPKLICQGKVRGGGRRQTRMDELISYTFEVMRNHCYNKYITQVTAHQLSTDAVKIKREMKSPGFIKKIAPDSYFEDCNGLKRKVDKELFVDIYDAENGDRYLCMSVGKDRSNEDIPYKWKNFFYKFEEFGGIVDDLHVEAPEGNALYSLANIENADTTNAGTGGMIIEDDGSGW